jgi:hypothetical protein
MPMRSSLLVGLLAAALAPAASAAAPSATESRDIPSLSTTGAGTGATADLGRAAEPARRMLKAGAALAGGLLAAGALYYSYRRSPPPGP